MEPLKRFPALSAKLLQNRCAAEVDLRGGQPSLIRQSPSRRPMLPVCCRTGAIGPAAKAGDLRLKDWRLEDWRLTGGCSGLLVEMRADKAEQGRLVIGLRQEGRRLESLRQILRP